MKKTGVKFHPIDQAITMPDYKEHLINIMLVLMTVTSKEEASTRDKYSEIWTKDHKDQR